MITWRAWVVEHGPAADFLDVAFCSRAEALAVERANADAGRHDAAPGGVHPMAGSGFLAELGELAPAFVGLPSVHRWRHPCPAARRRPLRSSPVLAFGGRRGLAPFGWEPGRNGSWFSMRMAFSNIAMFCLPIDSNCWNGLKPKAFCM